MVHYREEMNGHVRCEINAGKSPGEVSLLPSKLLPDKDCSGAAEAVPLHIKLNIAYQRGFLRCPHNLRLFCRIRLQGIASPLQLLPKLLVGSRYDGISRQQPQLLGMGRSCLSGSRNIADIARQQHHALAAHAAGHPKIKDLYPGSLYRNIGRFNGAGR